MQLEYSAAENKADKLDIVIEVASAIFLGGSMFAVLLSILDISWSPLTMFRGGFSDGVAALWNRFADVVGEKDYIILEKYALSAGKEGSASMLAGLTLTVILLSLIVISYLVIKGRFRPLLLLPLVPIVLVTLIYDISPGPWQGACLALAIIIAAIVMGSQENTRPARLSVALPAAVIAGMLILAIGYATSFSQPAFIQKFNESASKKADIERYGEDVLPQGKVGELSGKTLTSKRGNISDVVSVLGGAKIAAGAATETTTGTATEVAAGASGNTALEVTMDKPASLYLRGFVGADYSGTTWDPLTNKVMYNMLDDKYWLARQGFDGMGQVAVTSEIGGYGKDETDVKITVKDAGRRIAFVPYEYYPETAGKTPEGFVDCGQSYFRTAGKSGISSYEYRIIGNITDQWTEAVGKFYTAPKTAVTEQYFVNESNYNVIQYQKYLKVPDTLKKLFEQEIGSPGDVSLKHADYKLAIETVRNYLGTDFKYSEAFKASGNEDFIKGFLESKQGCDVHFASAATLLFRYYGIPARYIEGYLLTPSYAEGAGAGQAINVPKAANHAWTEIYIDGFGWIPVETCPEYYGIMKEADMGTGLQRLEYKPLTDKQQPRTDTAEEDETVRKTRAQKVMFYIVTTLLWIIAIAAIAFILYFPGRLIYRAVSWQLAFHDKDPRKAVRALFQFGNEHKWQFSDIGERIGYRASYSTEAVSDQDRINMKREFKRAKDNAHNHANGRRADHEKN